MCITILRASQDIQKAIQGLLLMRPGLCQIVHLSIPAGWVRSFHNGMTSRSVLVVLPALSENLQTTSALTKVSEMGVGVEVASLG